MATMKSKTRSQLQKELLDAELELFTKEQVGIFVSGICFKSISELFI